MIVQPGSVYGPGDHALVGQMIEQASTGKMPAKAFPELGLNMVHVDDVADGILLAYDRGKPGESYVLGGEIDAGRPDRQGGRHRRPAAPDDGAPGDAQGDDPGEPLGRPRNGAAANFREMISAAHNVTYWAKDDKARSELGYRPRDLETGLRETIQAG